MLALNAGIKAAKAGAADRGFMVVATEISYMAAQTKDDTASISGLISDVSAPHTGDYGSDRRYGLRH